MTSMTLHCSNCNQLNRPNARFCAACGHDLASQMLAPTRPLAQDTTRFSAQPFTVVLEPPPARNGTDTREITRIPFRPRASGAIFGNERRYQWTDTTASLKKNGRQIVYHVHPEQQVMICGNPECATVHGFVDESFCIECGSPMVASEVSLLLYESRTQADFARAAETIGRAVGPHVLLPLDYFSERVGGEVRYCLVLPQLAARAGNAPALVKQRVVMHWGEQLARGLDHLHAVGITFRGRIDAGTIATEDDRAYWTDFRTCKVLGHGEWPDDEHRDADLRALTVQLYRWATGQQDLAPASNLLPGVRRAFAQVLNGSAPVTGEALALLFASSIAPESSPVPVDFYVGWRTDIGRQREVNQDNLYTASQRIEWQGVNHSVGVFAIADGMGGHSDGEVASRIIIEILQDRTTSDVLTSAQGSPPDPEAWVKAGVQAANHAVYSHRQSQGTDMGSTVVMAYTVDTQAIIGHVGDCRAYLVDAHGLQQLTTDHSLVQRLVATGQITREQARSHPQRNVIYKVIGDRLNVEPDILSHTFQPGQSLLLCSDGLSGLVDDGAMFAIISSAASPQEAADNLIQAANNAGGTDNITAILVKFVPR